MTKKKIILYKGLPASGKSTHARNMVDQDSLLRRINRDDLRAMLQTGEWSQNKEKTIRKAEITLATLLLENGLTPVIDDCNLSLSAIKMWEDFALLHHLDIEWQDFTHISVEECVKRDAGRSNPVGSKVIRGMYHQYLKPSPPPKIVQDPNLPRAIVCDLDGTLCLFGHENPYQRDFLKDSPNLPVIETISLYNQEGYEIILVSGRKDTFKQDTLSWLEKYGVLWDFLYMRPTDDIRKDSIFKEEIYHTHLEGKYNIFFVLDDRQQVVDLWRGLGLTCFQVAEGDF